MQALATADEVSRSVVGIGISSGTAGAFGPAGVNVGRRAGGVAFEVLAVGQVVAGQCGAGCADGEGHRGVAELAAAAGDDNDFILRIGAEASDADKGVVGCFGIDGVDAESRGSNVDIPTVRIVGGVPSHIDAVGSGAHQGQVGRRGAVQSFAQHNVVEADVVGAAARHRSQEGDAVAATLIVGQADVVAHHLAGRQRREVVDLQGV